MNKKGYKEIFKNVLIKKEEEEKLRKIVAEWVSGEEINFEDIVYILESTGIKEGNNEVIITSVSSCGFDFYSETWGENGHLSFNFEYEGTPDISTFHSDIHDRFKIYFVGKRNGKIFVNELKE